MNQYFTFIWSFQVWIRQTKPTKFCNWLT